LKATLLKEVISVGKYSITVTPEKYIIEELGIHFAEIPFKRNVYSFLSLSLEIGKEMHVVTGGVGEQGSSLDDFTIIVADVKENRDVYYAEVLYRKDFN
jgi:hypothetical protein